MCFLNRIKVLSYLLLTFSFQTIWAQPAPSANQPNEVMTPSGPVEIHPGQIAPSTGVKPLVIGVDSFVPPFVMQGGNGELYGYDISMMNSLCKILNRPCKFQPIKFIELLPAVMNNQVDMAVSSITITPERAKLMSFSLPYGLSYSRFLTNTENQVAEPVALSSLDGNKIGVYKGTIYVDQASHIGVNKPIIQTYAGYEDALKALTNKEVDYILLDNPTALYWAANSSGVFKVVGQPYVYGFGIGIAVSNADKDMIPALNDALIQYQNSQDYKQNYQRFLESF